MELSKSKASILASLAMKKMRLKHGLFLVEGTKCVLDTIGAFELVNVIATQEWFKSNVLPENVDPSVILVTGEDLMRKISSLTSPPDVIAVFRLPDLSEDNFILNPDKLYLMLDGVQDPGNFGTIIRTADWFGIHDIICSKDTVDVFNPKVVQSTMGSLKRVRVHYTSLPEILRRNDNIRIFGLLLDGNDIFKSQLSESGVIIMGNEGSGISKELRSMITDPLLIPPYYPYSHGESLNVAVATAITLSQFRCK